MPQSMLLARSVVYADAHQCVRRQYAHAPAAPPTNPRITNSTMRGIFDPLGAVVMLGVSAATTGSGVAIGATPDCCASTRSATVLPSLTASEVNFTAAGCTSTISIWLSADVTEERSRLLVEIYGRPSWS